jgi:hypothetical protein
MSGENVRTVGEPDTAEEREGVGQTFPEANNGSSSGAAFEGGGVGSRRNRLKMRGV